MNKYEKINEWLKTYPALNEWIYFNATQMFYGNTSLNSVPNDRRIIEYIDGSYEGVLVFSLVLVKPYDVEQSTTNYEAIQELENLMRWVDENDTLPDFGENYVMEEIGVTSDAPSLAVDSENNLARYEFTARLWYMYTPDNI